MSDILYISRFSYFPGLLDHIIGLCVVSPCHGYILLPPFECIDYDIEVPLFLLFPSSILSVLLEIVSGVPVNDIFLFLSMVSNFSSQLTDSVFYSDVISKHFIILYLLGMIFFGRRSFCIKIVFLIINVFLF